MRRKKVPINLVALRRDFPERYRELKTEQGGYWKSYTSLEWWARDELLECLVLPVRGVFGSENHEEILTSCGVRYLSVVVGDRLFRHVELPDNWKFGEDPDSPKKIYLLDDRDRRRAAISYDPDPDGRKADIRLLTRFSVDPLYGDYLKGGKANILDGGLIIDTFGPICDGETVLLRIKEAARLAECSLDERYPDWRSFTAYWDDI